MTRSDVTAEVNTTYPFVEACLGRAHDHVPAWMMRQAGRFLPEYREVRKDHSFLEMCFTPELAAEVTLQPIRRFDMDAAIIFSDILVFLPAMGLNVDFPTGGPQISNPIGGREDVSRLVPANPEEAIPTVYEAIRICVDELGGKKPLIGFCGAPFTLACYAIEGRGSKTWSDAKAFLYQEPDAARELLDKLTTASILHLQAQVAAGAAAVQVFDSWAGVLGREDFNLYCKPYLSRIVKALKPSGVPVLLFARGVNPAWLAGIGADMYSFDWQTDLQDAFEAVGPAGVQGNLDPALLLGPRSNAVDAARKLVRSMAGINQYVFNLGHGVMPKTEPDTVKAVIDAVREESSRSE